LGIAFSSAFVEHHDLDEKTRVSVMVDAEARRLGFRFHTNGNDLDSFSLIVDGSNGTGRWFQSQRIYGDFPWLNAVLKRPVQRRRFPPKLSHGVWFIEIPD
jgi:hypothetical protein